MKLALLLALFTLACSRTETPPRPPVLLISIDTLRSDHLPAYGYRGSPSCDAAGAALVYGTPSRVPLRSIARVDIHRLLPEHTRARQPGFRLDAKTPSLASILRTTATPRAE